jgi:hypothetical protein
MTKETFLKATLSQISQVYSGKDHCCRCGCGGTYISTSYMDKPRNEINDKLAARRLKRAQSLLSAGAEYDIQNNYANIVTGNNRCLTFYFDEIKNN